MSPHIPASVSQGRILPRRVFARPLRNRLVTVCRHQRREQERLEGAQQAENQARLDRALAQQAENQARLDRALAQLAENQAVPAQQREDNQVVLAQQQRQQQQNDDYVRSQRAKALKLVISEPKMVIFYEALHKLDIIWWEAEWSEKPNFGAAPDPYVWDVSAEDSVTNREGYMNYLRNSGNITLPPRTHLLEGSRDQNLLSGQIKEFGHVIHVKGTVDVVLTPASQTKNMRQHILMAIELKKDNDNADTQKINRQVILQHLAASYLNPNFGVLTMMTDLNDRWHFFWSVKGKHVMQYAATRSEAVYLIQHSQDEEGQISTPASFLNRVCWNDLFPSTFNGTQMESFEYMDEEERREAELSAILRATLPRMFYIPEVEERPSENGIPGEIS